MTSHNHIYAPAASSHLADMSEDEGPYRPTTTSRLDKNIHETSTSSSKNSKLDKSQSNQLLPIDTSTDQSQQKHQRQSCAYYVKFGFLLFLRRFYHRLGMRIAAYPVIHILLILGVTGVMTAGLHSWTISRKLKDGYTPFNAKSRYEYQVYQEFSQTVGQEPTKTVLLVHGKHEQSLVNPKIFDRIADLSDFITNRLNVTVEGQVYTYSDFCESMCMIDRFVQTTRAALWSNASNSQTRLDYPTAVISGIPINLAAHFFGVTKNYTATGPNKLAHVSLIMLVYPIYATDPHMNEVARQWEMKLYQYVYEQHNDEHLELATTGDRMIIYEMNRSGFSMANYFIGGFSLMCIFIMVTIGGSAFYHGELSCSRMIVAWAALISPIFACCATFGLISWLQFEIYPLLMLVPYLILAIGVDDAFLMIHAWHRLIQSGGGQLSIAQRLALVLEDVGPSITITSLTNTLAFSIGASTETPVIRVFCMVTAIAMSIDFLFELVFFGSILALIGRWDVTHVEQRPSKVGHIRKKMRNFVDKAVLGYCKLLLTPWVRVVTVSLTLVFWAVTIWGAIRIKTVVSIHKVVPYDSPLIKADVLLEKFVWSEYYPLTVFVNKAPDFNDVVQVQQFNSMVADFETDKNAMGANNTVLWTRSYRHFLKSIEPADDGWFGDLYEASSVTEDLEEENVTLDLAELEGFMTWPQYSHYKPYIHFSIINGQPQVHSFAFWTAYSNATDWVARVAMLESWRHIADQYPQFNISLYDPNGYICDAISNLKTVTRQTIIITLCCMAAVCVLFIPSFWGIVCAAGAIASTSLGVVGSLSWWGNDLDPVTLAAVLMSIGFSVDFTAHTSYHYQKVHLEAHGRMQLTQTQRLVYTINSVAWPMFQAGISTICCVVPLAFHGDYPPTVFARTIYLLVSWGLIHGLILLPIALSMLPDCFVVRSLQQNANTAFPIDSLVLDPQNMASQTRAMAQSSPIHDQKGENGTTSTSAQSSVPDKLHESNQPF